MWHPKIKIFKSLHLFEQHVLTYIIFTVIDQIPWQIQNPTYTLILKIVTEAQLGKKAVCPPFFSSYFLTALHTKEDGDPASDHFPTWLKSPLWASAKGILEKNMKNVPDCQTNTELGSLMYVWKPWVLIAQFSKTFLVESNIP